MFEIFVPLLVARHPSSPIRPRSSSIVFPPPQAEVNTYRREMGLAVRRAMEGVVSQAGDKISTLGFSWQVKVGDLALSAAGVIY